MPQHYAELGYGLDPRPHPSGLLFPPIYRPVPSRRPVEGAYGPSGLIALERYAPLYCARWRWSGHPDLFDVLDLDGNHVVDENELREGLGQGLALARGETAGPLSAYAWQGNPGAFDLIDADRNGLVSREELEQALGPHALRLAYGHPAHGPAFPPGSRYLWRADVRRVLFPDREAKAQYMADAAVHDAEDPRVLAWAAVFRRLPLEQRALAILRFCQRCVRYERDPGIIDPDGTRHGIEVLDSSAVALDRGYGDCDAKARLFVALCLACALQATIEPVFAGRNGFPHVRARVRLVGSETSGIWDPRPRPAWSSRTCGPETADPTIVNSTIGHLPAHPRTR
jgi:hypothetical protein